MKEFKLSEGCIIFKKASLILLLIICFQFVGCIKGTDKQRVIKAAYVPAGYYLPFLIVEHDGLLEKRGYSMKLERFNDNAEMISLFLNGYLDVTAQSCFTMFPIELEHPGLFKFVYGQYANSYFFMTSIDSEIKSLSDLKNKTIGTWKSPTAENYIKLILKQLNFDYEEDYKVQRFNANELAAALENNTVPVIFGFDVPLSMLELSGNYRYLEKEIITRLIPGQKVFNGGGFIGTRLLSSNPQKANAIVEALQEAIGIIRRDPEHVADVIASLLGSTKEIAKNAKFDEFTWPNENLFSSAERTLQLLRENEIVKGNFSARSMFWIKNQ